MHPEAHLFPLTKAVQLPSIRTRQVVAVLNGKTGEDFYTPNITKENSYLKNMNNTAGLSYVGDKGYIGGSFSTYISDY